MNSNGITSEQILQMPELAHMYEAVRFLEGKEGKDLFPRKYQESMMDRGREKMYKLFKEQPTMPLKEAVVTVLSSFESELSGELLLKITEAIVQKWETLSKTVRQSAQELELA